MLIRVVLLGLVCGLLSGLASQPVAPGEITRPVNQPPIAFKPYVVTAKPVVLDGFQLVTHAEKRGGFSVRFSIPRADPRSVAGKAGLKDGDQVIEIEGRLVETMTASEFHREWRMRRGLPEPVLLLVKSKSKKARPAMLEFP